jgi:tetratricopeptide (TPR) repeat protein
LHAGVVYGSIGTPEKSPERALEYYRKSLKIGEELGLKDIIARASVNSATLYSILGDLSRTAEYYRKSLDLSEEIGHRAITMLSLNNLGNIYVTKGNNAKALELYLKCLKVRHK